MNVRSESQEGLTGILKISPEEIFKAYTLVLNKTREFCAKRQISEILPATNARCFEFIQEKMYWFGDAQNPDLILPSSHSFHKQYAAQYLGNVYTIGPCYRREPKARLNSHLFYQIEIEVFDSDIYQTQQLALDYLRYVEGAFCSVFDPSRTSMFETVNSMDLRNESEVSMTTAEFDRWSKELSMTAINPVWLNYTPQTVDPKLNKSIGNGFSAGFDLILSGNYGEIMSGGLRDKEEMKAFFDGDESIDTSLETSGFGIGLDRLIHMLLEADSLESIKVPYN